MDRSAKNKWQVRLAVLAVFLLGAAAGALALTAYHSWAGRGRAVGAAREERRAQRFEQMLDRLELSDDQKAQVRQILAGTHERLRTVRKESEPRMEEVRRETDERLRAVLTPEQWERFQQMKRQMHDRRGRGRKHDGPDR